MSGSALSRPAVAAAETAHPQTGTKSPPPAAASTWRRCGRQAPFVRSGLHIVSEALTSTYADCYREVDALRHHAPGEDRENDQHGQAGGPLIASKGVADRLCQLLEASIHRAFTPSHPGIDRVGCAPKHGRLPCSRPGFRPIRPVCVSTDDCPA